MPNSIVIHEHGGPEAMKWKKSDCKIQAEGRS